MVCTAAAFCFRPPQEMSPARKPMANLVKKVIQLSAMYIGLVKSNSMLPTPLARPPTHGPNNRPVRAQKPLPRWTRLTSPMGICIQLDVNTSALITPNTASRCTLQYFFSICIPLFLRAGQKPLTLCPPRSMLPLYA